MRIRRLCHIATWIGEYKWQKMLPGDLIAGLTVGAMAIPQSMSYAILAGLPVQFGLYSDLQIAYPLLGSSHALVVGPG
jgi:MFS superfamily sulfate permease-like transporter